MINCKMCGIKFSGLLMSLKPETTLCIKCKHEIALTKHLPAVPHPIDYEQVGLVNLLAFLKPNLLAKIQPIDQTSN